MDILQLIEIFAFVTGVLYLILEIAQKNAMWVIGILTGVACAYSFAVQRLWASMGLNIYYVFVSIWGLYQWRRDSRMLAAGEDPKFIARRIMICAAEDVGLADPGAMTVAVSASEVLERVGMPEGRIPLALAAVYVATAPKSNASYMGLEKAMEAVEKVQVKQVPPHLQGTGYSGAVELGKGIGYQYAHDFPGHFVRQQYLPDELLGSRFLEIGENGYELTIKKYMEFLAKL